MEMHMGTNGIKPFCDVIKDLHNAITPTNMTIVYEYQMSKVTYIACLIIILYIIRFIITPWIFISHI